MRRNVADVLLTGAGLGETVSSSVCYGGHVKSLGVIESNADDLSVSVIDSSGLPLSHASLTTLPNAQLGMQLAGCYVCLTVGYLLEQEMFSRLFVCWFCCFPSFSVATLLVRHVLLIS